MTQALLAAPLCAPTSIEPFFRWDGIHYYGECWIDGLRCYYLWMDDVVTSEGKWVRIDYEIDGVAKVEVERERQGYHVYAAFEMTEAQRDHLDTWHSLYDAHRDRGEDALKEAFLAAGLDRYKLSGDAFKNVAQQKCVGYWRVNGLEYYSVSDFCGTLEELRALPQEKQDWVMSLPATTD